MLSKIKIILLIAKWEFKEKFFHKTFLISFLISQLLLFFAIYFIHSSFDNHKTQIYPIAFVIDNSNPNFINKSENNLELFFVKIKKSDYIDKNKNFSIKNVLDNNFVAYLEISGKNVNIFFSSDLQKDEIIKIQNYFNSFYSANINFSFNLVDKTDQILHKKIVSHFGIVFLFIFAILISSNLFLRGFAAEKESKLLELLISSTNFNNILIGKTIGLFIFICIQFFVWSLVSVVSNKLLLFEAFVNYLIVVLLFVAVIFYILFFLVTSLITKHESETNIILSIVTFLLVLPFLFIDKLIYTQDTFISYFLQYFPFTSFPALIIKSVKPIINNEQIIIAITVLIISIGILIYYISKFLFSASIIHNVINFYSKRKEK